KDVLAAFEIQNIVSDLEGHSQIISILLHMPGRRTIRPAGQGPNQAAGRKEHGSLSLDPAQVSAHALVDPAGSVYLLDLPLAHTHADFGQNAGDLFIAVPGNDHQ